MKASRLHIGVALLPLLSAVAARPGQLNLNR